MKVKGAAITRYKQGNIAAAVAAFLLLTGKKSIDRMMY